MDSEMTSGGYECAYETKNSYKVIHIHPTLRCNLLCKHCYSSSAPNLKGGIDLNLLKSFLEYAYTIGFNVISVSGGEPFLYDHLKELLVASKKIGYQTQTATNGMLLKAAKSKECLEHLDLVAISIDGNREKHDEIRCFKGAFDKTVEGIELLNKLNKDFGIIHTITNQSWENLLWLSDFAYEHGAKLLQLHPLELYGRASEQLFSEGLTQESLHKTHIIGTYLQSKFADKMRIQMDFLHREYIEEYPSTIHYQGENYKITEDNFAEFIKTIVINEQGTIYPVSYGFSDDFAICELSASNSFEKSFAKFVTNKGEQLYKLLSESYKEIVSNQDKDLVAWTEYIVAKSNKKI